MRISKQKQNKKKNWPVGIIYLLLKELEIKYFSNNSKMSPPSRLCFLETGFALEFYLTPSRQVLTTLQQMV